VLAIGSRGGRVRASTGYSVTRILTDSRAIARSLAEHGHPFVVPPDPRRDRVLDRVWLRALARERAGLEPAFLRLFAGAPIDGVLRFLDGRAGPGDVARVVRALPPAPFLRAAVLSAADTVLP
jgi:lycopene beta-cyclase